MKLHEIMNLFADSEEGGNFPEVPPMSSVTEKPWMTHGRYHFSRTTGPAGMSFKNLNRWWRYPRDSFYGDWDYAGYQMATENWEEQEKKFNDALVKTAGVLSLRTEGAGSDRFSFKTMYGALSNLYLLAKALEEHTHNSDGTGFFNAYQEIDVPDGPFRGSAAGVYANILYGFATRLNDLANQTSDYWNNFQKGLNDLYPKALALNQRINDVTDGSKNSVQSVMNHWYYDISAGTERWLEHRDQFEVRWRLGTDDQEEVYGIPGDGPTNQFINSEIQNMWKDRYSGVIEAANDLFKYMESAYSTTFTSLTPIDDPISGSLSNGTTTDDNKSGNGDDDFWKKYLKGLNGENGEGPPGIGRGDWDWNEILGNPGGGGSGGGGNYEPPPLGNAPPLPNNYPGLGNGAGGGWNGESSPPPGYEGGGPDLGNTFPGADGLSDGDWSIDGAGRTGGAGPLDLNGPGSGGAGLGSPVNGFTSPGGGFDPPLANNFPGGGFDPPLDTNFPVGGGIVPPLGASGPGGSTGDRRQQNADPGLPTNFPAPSSLELDPESGLPIDPDTGRPFPVDPDTGRPFNPDTGLPLNFDPVTGQVSPIDPLTGLPVDAGGVTPPPSDPGLPTNFPEAENVPLNPITGEPAELDPLTDIPYPIDPRTGEPIRGGLDTGDFESPLPRMESSDDPAGLNYPGAGGGPTTSSSDPGSGEPGTADRSAMFSAPGGEGAPGQTGDGAGGAAGASSPFQIQGQGSSGMPPMMPPMGGMGGGGGGGDNGRERNRATWLSEDEKVWGTDKTRGKAVLGRPVPGEKKGTARHEFIDAGADGSRTGTASNDDARTGGRKRKPGVGNRRGNGQEQTRDRDGRRDRSSD